MLSPAQRSAMAEAAMKTLESGGWDKRRRESGPAWSSAMLAMDGERPDTMGQDKPLRMGKAHTVRCSHDPDKPEDGSTRHAYMHGDD